MHLKRMLNLVESIVNAPEDKFNMGSWVKPVCGTPQCMLGWYSTRNDQDKFSIGKDPLNPSSFCLRSIPRDLPRLDAAKHFGITPDEAGMLFVDFPGKYNVPFSASKSEAIKTILKMIGDKTSAKSKSKRAKK